MGKLITAYGLLNYELTTIVKKIWDPRQKNCVDYMETSFPITAVAVSDAGNEVYTGGIDNDIKVHDVFCCLVTSAC